VLALCVRTGLLRECVAARVCAYVQGFSAYRSTRLCWYCVRTPACYSFLGHGCVDKCVWALCVCVRTRVCMCMHAHVLAARALVHVGVQAHASGVRVLVRCTSKPSGLGRGSLLTVVSPDGQGVGARAGCPAGHGSPSLTPFSHRAGSASWHCPTPQRAQRALHPPVVLPVSGPHLGPPHTHTPKHHTGCCTMPQFPPASLICRFPWASLLPARRGSAWHGVGWGMQGKGCH